ncbi:hypothetical protein AC629_38230 [Bradyrhizobium sp. NAS80.1]|nr:hypothetical protein AC629_38230 [Bradyrhizobium sp. NAS80.1]
MLANRPRGRDATGNIETIDLNGIPKLDRIDLNILVQLQKDGRMRDAFDDDELLTLLKQPPFTGCKNRMHVWKEGGYFAQSHIYWGFLICILTGRAGLRSVMRSQRRALSRRPRSQRVTRGR